MTAAQEASDGVLLGPERVDEADGDLRGRDKGEVQMQTEVVTDPDAIAAALKPFLPRLLRAGHGAGSLSPWLQPELVKRGLPAVCLETKHVRAAMSAQRNRTDAADALGLAHIVRTGLVPAGPYQGGELLSPAALLTQ